MKNAGFIGAAQGVGLGGYQQAGLAASNYPPDVKAPADTLVRALASLGDLNKRLSDLKAGVYQTAEAIGGPYPVSEPKSEQISSPSAMSQLNRRVEEAHQTLDDINEAVAAIRRSLGA